MPSTVSFPTQPEALTVAWLNDKLADVIGEPVEAFDVQLFGEGAGIIGQVTRLRLTTPAGERSVIAKFPSPAPENRAVAATYNMYGREVLFYQEIARLISLRVPDSYFAAFDAGPQDFVILMEDLQGYRIGDQVAGCTDAEAALVVEGIARLHTSTWEIQHDRLISHNNPAQRDGMIGGFGVGWPVVSEQFPDLLPAGADKLADKLPDAVGRLLDAMCTPPVSVAHADVRLDNVFLSSWKQVFI